MSYTEKSPECFFVENKILGNIYDLFQNISLSIREKIFLVKKKCLFLVKNEKYPPKNHFLGRFRKKAKSAFF